jgi:hypothetical protein
MQCHTDCFAPVEPPNPVPAGVAAPPAQTLTDDDDDDDDDGAVSGPTVLAHVNLAKTIHEPPHSPPPLIMF